MPGDDYYERPLFGGAISSVFPLRFQVDVSEVREVPDHQEAFADSRRDESLIFELLEFKQEVEDNVSAVWFLSDIAREQDAEKSMGAEAAKADRERSTMIDECCGMRDVERDDRRDVGTGCGIGMMRRWTPEP
ncbi:hypothetical protein KSP40_PGU010656 [Platanthera guangdongensis]|uniref:Uncharacterized protein n=1 Tax=Platanthera guangdongensis TaxID=2320717 RepID=A0ABR2N400_9ASPA